MTIQVRFVACGPTAGDSPLKIFKSHFFICHTLSAFRQDVNRKKTKKESYTQTNIFCIHTHIWIRKRLVYECAPTTYHPNRHSTTHHRIASRQHTFTYLQTNVDWVAWCEASEQQTHQLTTFFYFFYPTPIDTATVEQWATSQPHHRSTRHHLCSGTRQLCNFMALAVWKIVNCWVCHADKMMNWPRMFCQRVGRTQKVRNAHIN